MRLLPFTIVLVPLVAAPSANEVTLTGVVSDATSGIDHRGRPAGECVRSCVEESIEDALVVASKVYTLVGEDDVKAPLFALAERRPRSPATAPTVT